jgi:acyl-CoA hydrolase
LGLQHIFLFASQRSKKVIVEVNESAPRVFCDAFIHESEVDAIIENHLPLSRPVLPPKNPCDEIIGKRFAELILDEASLQLGMETLPNAIAKYLEGYKDPCIHFSFEN